MVYLTGDQHKDTEEAVGVEIFRHKTLLLSVYT